MKKIGYFEKLEPIDNEKDYQVVQSGDRLNSFLALVSALGLAYLSVLRADVTLGDSLPFVITLLAYAAGQKIFGKAIEKIPEIPIGRPKQLKK